MANIYVASSFVNIPETREVMDALVAAGHSISHDWTTCQIPEHATPEEAAAYLRTCGDHDWAGVCNADTLVLVNHDAGRDARAEFGAALAMGKRVIVMYPERRASVFFHLATACAGSVPEMLTLL